MANPYPPESNEAAQQIRATGHGEIARDGLLWRLWLGIGRTSALDLRSLALFRIALGLVILADLGQRAQHLQAFYGPDGILPLSAVPSLPPLPFQLFTHPAMEPFAAPLVALGVVAALLFTMGFRARTMGVICWVLLASLNYRNWLLLHLADRLFLLFLLWACLLPIGARWGIDAHRKAARREAPPEEPYFSPATLGLHLQVTVVYLTAGLLKARQPTWVDGSHLGQTLDRIEYLKAPGMMVRDLTVLHAPLTWSVLALQVFGAFLLLTPFRFTGLRVGVVGSLILLQLGMGSTLNVGLFPWVSIVGLVALLPPGIWKTQVVGVAQAPSLRPGTRAAATPRRIAGRLRDAVAVLLILIMAVETLNDHLQFGPRTGVISMIPGGRQLMQRWTMFTGPAEYGGWFVVAGVTPAGDTINLLRGGEPVEWEPPPDPWNDFRGHRWRIVVTNSLRYTQRPENRTDFLRFLMTEWNAGPGMAQNVISVSLIEMRYPLDPGTTPRNAQPVILGVHP